MRLRKAVKAVYKHDMGKIYARKLLHALRFLTIVPVPGGDGGDSREIGGSAVMFPVVGVLIGFAFFIVGRISLFFWSMDAVSALIVFGWAAVSGGLHLDGLSDTMDGLGGGKTREKRLEIMKDSRIGSFGAAALFLSLLMKYAFLGEIETASLLPILVLVPAVARALMLGGIYLFPAARPEGMGAFFKKHLVKKDVIAALAGTGILVFLLSGPIGILVALAAAGIGWFVLYSLTALLGGLTGDSCGALIEISEIALLAGFTATQRLILFPLWKPLFS